MASDIALSSWLASTSSPSILTFVQGRNNRQRPFSRRNRHRRAYLSCRKGATFGIYGGPVTIPRFTWPLHLDMLLPARKNGTTALPLRHHVNRERGRGLLCVQWRCPFGVRRFIAVFF